MALVATCRPVVLVATQRPQHQGCTAMTMKPGLRTFALTAHVTFSVGWLGAAAGCLALSVAALTSRDAT